MIIMIMLFFIFYLQITRKSKPHGQANIFLPLSKKIISIGLTHKHTTALNHLFVSNNVQKSDLFSRKRRGQLSSHFLLRPCDETLPKQLGPEAKREQYHTRLSSLCCFRQKRRNRQIIVEPFSSSPVIKFSRPAAATTFLVAIGRKDPFSSLRTKATDQLGLFGTKKISSRVEALLFRNSIAQNFSRKCI